MVDDVSVKMKSPILLVFSITFIIGFYFEFGDF